MNEKKETREDFLAILDEFEITIRKSGVRELIEHVAANRLHILARYNRDGVEMAQSGRSSLRFNGLLWCQFET